MKNNYYIGIDPSVNSTGLVIRKFIDDKLEYEKFYIIKGDKLTKKEQAFTESHSNFDYIIYKKTPITNISDNHELEYIKCTNLHNIVTSITDIILDLTEEVLNYMIDDNIKNFTYSINIVMEGISYGSVQRTRSIFDLAGLNYLIREAILNLSLSTNIKLFICTPAEIKKHITGNGNANKEQIVAVFKILVPDMNAPKIDDISDAYFMSCYSEKFK